MKVFKFGGASVRNSAAIKNVVSIIKTHRDEPLLIVVSAMGDTTDELEQIVALAQLGKDFSQDLERIRKYHSEIITELFSNPALAEEGLQRWLAELKWAAIAKADHDQVYDQVVSLGELISTTIIELFLKEEGLHSTWADARNYISTNGNFREGKVNWEKTTVNIQALEPLLADTIIITQGFIGSTPKGLTTTLGREGSDFSAAIFASCLRAESLTIWKDVPGVMNADPKRLNTAKVFDELPFKEAAEMTYYGASIIHPKTIKPLANRGIPLWVKSFVNPLLPGTVIHECKVSKLPPLIVFKENQCLISCQVTDYSFISEQQIGAIFQTLSENNIKMNVMQSSAISFSFCVDFRENKILALIDELGKNFEVFYNTGLTLVTIKNYDTKLYAEYRNLPGVILEQSSRSTLQVLIKK